jgi:FAD/FMN-containing dehydrogenase
MKTGTHLELRARMKGQVVAPGEAGWDLARQAWNLAVDQRPALVALPESAQDVVAVVGFARRHGLRLAPQGTGHNAGPLGPLEDAVLVKTSRMRCVAIDPETRTARVDAGVLWMEVTEAAAEHGLAALAGSSPDVGVVGYSLGGGVSWLTRKHGLAANSITAVELVTADGRLVRADADHHPELFWALRGGGGSFGVVTALEFRLYPITEVYAGVLFFPLERASEVLHAWRVWTEDVPDEVTSVGRILHFPPLEDLPEHLRGRSFAVVEATVLGDEADGAGLIAPLRALGPELDTFATIHVRALARLHMDPESPVPAIGDGSLLTDLPAAAVDAFVGAAADPAAGLLTAELRHLGGALGRAAPEHGALASLAGEYLFFAAGFVTTPELGALVEAGVGWAKVALAPWEARQMYLNFAETRRAGGSFHADDAYRRLREVKAAYDPGDLFRSNHPVPPAEVEQARAA